MRRTEALAVQAMKGATRAGHYARVTAADLKNHGESPPFPQPARHSHSPPPCGSASGCGATLRGSAPSPLRPAAGALDIELRRARSLVVGAVDRRAPPPSPLPPPPRPLSPVRSRPAASLTAPAPRPRRSYARLLGLLENASFVPYSTSLAALASPSPRQSLLFSANPPPSAAGPLLGIAASAVRAGVPHPQPSPPASPGLRPWDPALPLGDRPLTVRVGISAHSGA